MTTKERYNAIVIGAGQAGTPLSRTLAQAGWKKKAPMEPSPLWKSVRLCDKEDRDV
jgi:pyruvate/2-oxoglutarate dehydrogenase complex dihydrolipoamide dehydrogenase (E3) component